MVSHAYRKKKQKNFSLERTLEEDGDSTRPPKNMQNGKIPVNITFS